MKSSSKNARADGNVCWNQNLLPHAALEAATGTTRRHSSLRWPQETVEELTYATLLPIFGRSQGAERRS